MDMDFGVALSFLRAGKRMARIGWNGKDMWISLNPGSKIFVSEGRPLASIFPVGTEVDFRPYLIMKTADGSIVPWVASQTDILAEDWQLAWDTTI